MQFIDLKAQYEKLKNEINENIQHVLNSTNYLMGNYVYQLEEELSKYVGVKYCITCANGTDALQLALMAINTGPGDAVFVPSFTFFSTAEVVSILGATPIFIDTDVDTFNIDNNQLEVAIKRVIEEGKLQPKAIIPVDLFGLPANFKEINRISKKYDLVVIEDGAQGFGGSINNKRSCSFGDISTTSFFPAKPLGCYGDGGAIFTNSDEYNDKLKSLRVHGKGSFKYDNVRIGMNSRLDEIQAAILLPKLNAFKKFEVIKRNEFAKQYTKMLKHIVKTPEIPEGYTSSWAQYTILLNSRQEREYLQNKLKEFDIPTMIYYPKPLHKQNVYSGYVFNLENLKNCEMISETCLSLPMHPYLTSEVVGWISEKIIKIVEDYRSGKQ